MTTTSTLLHRHSQDLYARGNTSLLEAEGRVAIVGSRACTAYGTVIAQQAATAIARQGGTIIASSAHGIESHAARAALATEQPTILVQAAGLNHDYPRVNAELVHRTLENGGLLLSVSEDDAPPTRHAFIQAAMMRGRLAHHALLVEAGIRSMAVSAVSACESRWACPGPLTSATSRAPHQMITEGARLWTEDPNDITEMVRTSDPRA